MALVKLQSAMTYKSQVGQSAYTFTVQVDGQGLTSVRDIRGPNGLIQDSYTSLPSQVVDDIYTSQGMTTALLAETSIESGTSTFVAETTKTVTFTTPLNNTNYRVALSYSPIGPVGTVVSKTTTGFTISLSITYTGAVSWAALQKASSTSDYCGTAAFTSASPTQAVTFTSPAASAGYRVLLSPDGFYPVSVIDQTVSGFTIQLGISLAAPTTASVGFDVFFS